MKSSNVFINENIDKKYKDLLTDIAKYLEKIDNNKKHDYRVRLEIQDCDTNENIALNNNYIIPTKNRGEL